MTTWSLIGYEAFVPPILTPGTFEKVARLATQSTGASMWNLGLPCNVRTMSERLFHNSSEDIVVHCDRAARMAASLLGARAFCYNRRIFLGPTVGTVTGPSLAEVLRHELVHVAQMDYARHSGKYHSAEQVEHEAAHLSSLGSESSVVTCGAAPDQIYGLWWLLPLAAAAYVILRPNVANAPAPGGRTLPSVSEAQVAGEALALFAVPEASFTLGGRMGLGLLSRSAVAGASATMSYRGVQDGARGEFSGVQAYVYDGITGAAIGYVVPGGIRLVGGGAVRSLDWLATQGMRRSDFAITRIIVDRAARNPLTESELTALLENQGVTGRVAEWWLNRRGSMILYRGQGEITSRILSPMARQQGIPASEALVTRMRAAGLTNEEIAAYTARWHTQPVPRALAPAELAGEPLGAAGIPTTRIPGIAANFGDNGVVYVIRLPRTAAIRVPRWGLAVENEWVVLNEIPQESIVQIVPARRLPALEVNDAGRLILGRPGQ